MSVADYNTDPNSNTSISGINIAEGCPPSGINNAIRQMMADIKTADNANVKLSGNQTISGTKTFSSTIQTGASQTALNSKIPLGGTLRDPIQVSDSSDVRVGIVRGEIGGDGDRHIGIFSVGSNNSIAGSLVAGIDKDGIAYTKAAATSSTRTNGTDIITRDYFNNNVVKLSGDQTVGGVKTFTSPIVITDNDISVRRSNATGVLRITGGNSTLSDEGAMLSLFGSGHSNLAGYFRMYTGGAVHPYMEGRPSGKLTWDGKDILCVSESGSNYIRFSNGLQICWGSVTISTASTGLAVTFPKAFSATPDITFGLRPGSASTKLYNVLAYPRSSTGFTAYANDAAGHMAAATSYIAIGSWA